VEETKETREKERLWTQLVYFFDKIFVWKIYFEFYWFCNYISDL
jgi:hypothetical protein